MLWKILNNIYAYPPFKVARILSEHLSPCRRPIEVSHACHFASGLLPAFKLLVLSYEYTADNVGKHIKSKWSSLSTTGNRHTSVDTPFSNSKDRDRYILCNVVFPFQPKAMDSVQNNSHVYHNTYSAKRFQF
jgi:hypothetical protein